MNYDIEDPYRTDDWKSTNSHKGEIVIAYDDKVQNKTLRPRVYYALYIRPSNNSNGHLIYRLSIDQILVTKEYLSLLEPKDLIETINETHSYDNKIQVIYFNSNQSIAQDYYSSNHNKDGHTHIIDKNDSEDESHKELNSLPQP